ncbi:unnamed protein product [Nesidiocoris tenuis]|uniref:Uncharacterized protein n=1 Tax=Nesidiocoris tenuis TaxID=355587 RepID=A0A6H5HKU5_9HEMI|nr:unnamed protein product [Nesidiocoris tenuis]
MKGLACKRCFGEFCHFLCSKEATFYGSGHRILGSTYSSAGTVGKEKLIRPLIHNGSDGKATPAPLTSRVSRGAQYWHHSHLEFFNLFLFRVGSYPDRLPAPVSPGHKILVDTHKTQSSQSSVSEQHNVLPCWSARRPIEFLCNADLNHALLSNSYQEKFPHSDLSSRNIRSGCCGQSALFGR